MRTPLASNKKLTVKFKTKIFHEHCGQYRLPHQLVWSIQCVPGVSDSINSMKCEIWARRDLETARLAKPSSSAQSEGEWFKKERMLINLWRCDIKQLWDISFSLWCFPPYCDSTSQTDPLLQAHSLALLLAFMFMSTAQLDEVRSTAPCWHSTMQWEPTTASQSLTGRR